MMNEPVTTCRNGRRVDATGRDVGLCFECEGTACELCEGCGCPVEWYDVGGGMWKTRCVGCP